MSPANAQLTREDIVRAAMRLADSEGLDGLSMRRLAEALGVTPMALYRHVSNKDEILAEVVGAVLRGAGLPDVGAGDWAGWLAAAAHQLRTLLVEHPGALGVFCREPVTTPAAAARLAEGLERLQAAGFGTDEAARAYAAVHTYTIGFCSPPRRGRREPEPTHKSRRSPASTSARSRRRRSSASVSRRSSPASPPRWGHGPEAELGPVPNPACAVRG